MKKIIRLTLVLALALPMLLLGGCKGARPLPDGMDEEATGQAARDIVSLLVQGDYQAVADAFRADLREEYSVTAGTVEGLMDSVSAAGPFVQFTETLVLGGKSDSFDEPYAAVAVYCEHESKDVVYELSLDQDLALIGLAAKLK